jgi:hypothetical protein
MTDHPIRVNNKVYNKGRKLYFATENPPVLERPTPAGVTIIRVVVALTLAGKPRP